MSHPRFNWHRPFLYCAYSHVSMSPAVCLACSIRGDAEKRKLLLQHIDQAGRQQLMRGRVR